MPSLTERVMRRVQHAVSFARTSTAPDSSGPVQTVQLRPDDLRVFDTVRILQHFGFTSCPPIGSVMVTLAGQGDSTTAIAIGSAHEAGPTGLVPGQSVQWDGVGSRVVLPNDGSVHLYPKGGQVIVHADLVVQGNLILQGKVLAEDANGAAQPLQVDTPQLRVSGAVSPNTGS